MTWSKLNASLHKPLCKSLLIQSLATIEKKDNRWKLEKSV